MSLFQVYTLIGLCVCMCVRALDTKHYNGCQESVEWNGGMEHWNGILEWVN